jgi:hypothetical protein
MLHDLVRTYLGNSNGPDTARDARPQSSGAVRGAATIISKLVEHNPVLEEQVERWLTDESGEYAAIGLDARRAIMATLAQDQGECH